MPPNPHAPGSAGSPDPQVDVSAEMERRKAEMLGEIITNINTVTGEQRDRLAKLLGEKIPDKVKQKDLSWLSRARGLTLDLTPDKPDIIRILASTDGAMAHLLPEYFKDWKTIDLGSGEEDLEKFILDPKSDDAKWLMFVYKKFKTPELEKEMKALLQPGDFDPVQANQLNELSALRTEYAALQADTSFHDLDRKKADLAAKKTRYETQLATLMTPATPPPVGSGSTYVNVNTGAGNTDPTAQIERLNKLIDDLIAQDTSIDSKKNDLRNRLEAIDKRGYQVDPPSGSSGPYVPPAITSATLGTFNASTQPSTVMRDSPGSFTWATKTIDIDGTPHTIDEWMTKPETGPEMTRLKAKSKRGKALISAGTALDNILRSHFAAREPGATEAEREAMVKQMRSAFSKQYEEKKPEEPKEKEKKGKNDGDTKKRSWWGSAWSSFAGYMMERDKTLLGFPVESDNK